MNANEVLTLVFSALAIVGLAFGLRVGYRHIKLLGVTRYRECLGTFRRAQGNSAAWGARDVAYVWLLATGLTLGFGGQSTLWLASLFAMLTTMTLAASLAAPTVVVLGASESESLDLMTAAAQAISPFRVKHMMSAGGRYSAGGPYSVRQRTEGWTLRRKEPWTDVLVRFLRVVPIVLVDVRNRTPSLDLEIKQIDELHINYKTIVFSERKTPATGNVSQTIGDPQECGFFLRFILNVSGKVPTPHCPITALYQTFRSSPPELRRFAALGRPHHSTWPYRFAISELRKPSSDVAAELFGRAQEADARQQRNLSPGRRRQLYEEATALYQQAIKKDRNCAKIQSAFGIFLARCGNVSEARKCFESANDLAPGNAWIEANLAKCYDQLRQHDLAERWWQEAEIHKPPRREAPV